MPLGLLAAVAILSTALMRSDLEHRTESVLDGLTGMLNRRALSARIDELDEQARLTGEPVGVVIGDLDHFKLVNDEHGHARGDAVLVDVAYALRKQLRAFDLAYRVGGEEFLVLLPGATLAETEALAERLRAAVADAPVGRPAGDDVVRRRRRRPAATPSPTRCSAPTPRCTTAKRRRPRPRPQRRRAAGGTGRRLTRE